MIALPQGWCRRRLGDTLEHLIDHRGQTPGKLGGKFQDHGVPVISAIHIKGGRVDFSRRERFVSQEMFERWMPERLRSGDVLLTSEAPMGSVAFVPSDAPLVLSQRLFALRGRSTLLDNRYLRWALEAQPIRDQLDRRSSGTTVTGIRQSELVQVELPLPSLSEQRWIVDILEDHLSRLDAAIDACTATRLRLAAFRVSSLSSVLVDRDDWPQVALGDVLDVSIGGLWGSEPGGDEVDVRVLRVTELKQQGRLDPSTAARRSIARRQLTTRQLQTGDLLLEKSGGGPKSPVGRVGLVEALEAASICANFMQLMRPCTDQVIPRFLHLYLNAFYLRGGTVPMQKATTNIRNLKASEYLKIPVPLPDKNAQEAAVSHLEVVLSAADLMERTIDQTLARGDALRRALLSAAFSGRLRGRSTDTEMLEEMAGV